MITCQATPGGKLANQVRKAIGNTEEGNRILVQEEGCEHVTLRLKQSNLIKKKGCIQKKQACLGQRLDEKTSIPSVNTRKRSSSPVSSPDKKPRCDHAYGKPPVDEPLENDS